MSDNPASQLDPVSKASWKDRLKVTFKRGGPEGPRFRLVDLILVIAGASLLITGLILASSTPKLPRTAYTQVSLTSLLQASAAGQLESVTFPSTPTAATALIKEEVSSGPLAKEFGSTVPAGTSVSVYVPTTVVNSTVETLAQDGVTVWMGPASIAMTGPAMVGMRVPPQNTAPAVAPAGPATTVPVDSGLASKAPLFVIGGVVLLIVGAWRMASYSRRRSAAVVEAAAAVKVDDVPSTRFEDVAGADEAVESMKELVDFIKNSSRYTELGARLPKGALLVGPPGTGKTLLARAVAGEAGVPFFPMAGSEFVEKYVGVGAKRVRDLFAQARKAGQAIIFIDEIDAVARKRTDGSEGHANTEAESTLNQLLTEMDGFTGTDIIVLAATNRPDILDPAITRSGRLDRRIEVPLPDRRGREHILGVHAKRLRLDPEVDLGTVAARTPGFSGAQLEAVTNEAALEAVRKGLNSVSISCFDSAVATVAMGKARVSAVVTDADRTITAWHEAGHTLAALLLADADAPVAVSIIPRGPAGGVTWMAGSDDIFLSRAKAHARLVVALSGRTAEQLLLGGEFTQGASSDLQNATESALLMATRYGMTRLGLASRDRHLGGTSTKDVTEVVEELLEQAQDQSMALLQKHFDLLEAIALELLEKDDLTAADLDRIARRLEVTPAYHPTPVPAPPRRNAPAQPEDEAVPVPVLVPAVAAPAPVVVTSPVSLAARMRAAAAAARQAFKDTSRKKVTY